MMRRIREVSALEGPSPRKLVDNYLECSHEYPHDWLFSGADGCDPRSDWRWRPSSYIYVSSEFVQLWITVESVCDEDALDKFTWVRDNLGGDPKFIMVRRPDESTHQLMPWVYDPKTDEVREVMK